RIHRRGTAAHPHGSALAVRSQVHRSGLLLQVRSAIGDHPSMAAMSERQIHISVGERQTRALPAGLIDGDIRAVSICTGTWHCCCDLHRTVELLCAGCQRESMKAEMSTIVGIGEDVDGVGREV